MVIEMNEAQVRKLVQAREVLAGTQQLQLRLVADQTGRYAWIEQALKRFDYWCFKRMERTWY
jgi:predicted xylose isomerase-like sugar epimerase